MEQVEVGTRSVVWIWQDSPTATSPPLGTDVDEGSATGPTVANWERIDGIRSLTQPIDNNPQETIELGTRTIQRWMGALGLAGRLEKTKGDSEFVGANSVAAYVAGVIDYTRADYFTKFKLRIYKDVPVAQRDAAATKYADDSSLDTAMAGYSERVELTKLKLHNYDSTNEPNAVVSETMDYSAEDMTIERKTT